MLLPEWIGQALRWLAAALALVFASVAIFATVVMPYRYWDSLAFGSWSRSIAETGQLWANAPALYLQRPLFYVEQGLAWRVFGEEEWIGRLLSLSFALVFALALWMLASRLTEDRDGRLVMAPLALCLVLATSALATSVASGMTDVPVAAMVAATGAALWSDRRGLLGTVLIALLAAAAVLAKPTALLSLAGLVPAVFVLQGRRAFRQAFGIVAGVALALAYDRWQAARLGTALSDFLTAGNDKFWRDRGAAARWDAVARGDWLGGGLRLLVVFGLAYAVGRAVGARTRVALTSAAAIALMWSIVGPVLADGETGYPFNGSATGIVAWLVLAATMLAAPFLAVDDPIARRTYVALVVWSTPMIVAWVWQRADEVRHLAPAWAPLVLMTAGALASVTLALARIRPAAALAPATAIAVLVLSNLVSIDGLGSHGWRDLLELGRSGWTSREQMENFAYGPFSYELNLARENVGARERIVSSDGRLAYFFPNRVDIEYATSCESLSGARFFSFLESGESREFAQKQNQPLDPLGWMQCARPHIELVGEQPGIYAAFVVGGQPARTPTLDDCHISSTPGTLVDGLFGDGLTYADASSLYKRAVAVGFQGTRLERTGCSTFRVVDPGFPEKRSVQREFRREAERVGMRVDFIPAVRYPEAPADVTAVG
jgi:hypothetical protein